MGSACASKHFDGTNFNGTEVRWVHTQSGNATRGRSGPLLVSMYCKVEVLAPPGNDPYLQTALKDARTELEPWLSHFRGLSANVTIYESIQEFSKWASRQDATDLDSTAVVIVSHHDGGRLYMLPTASLPAANIQRQMRRPAAVILSACGTAELGGTDVMRNFLLSGANAVVGTGTEVEGRMAGKFVSLLLDDVRARSNDPKSSLGQIMFAAIQKLRRETFANGKGVRCVRASVRTSRRCGIATVLALTHPKE